MLLACVALFCTAAQAQSTNWRNVVIGGGGFVTGTVFHPTEPGLVYARTDVGGAYRMDSSTGGRWKPLNDEIGGLNNESQHLGVMTIGVDPSDANRVYVFTGQFAGPDSWKLPSRVYRSTNRGDSWTYVTPGFKMMGNGEGRGTGERCAVNPVNGAILLVGFTSCKRFHGKININADRLQVVGITENLTLAPGARWEMEELFIAQASSSATALDAFAVRIDSHHPRLPWLVAPNGWCSWYAYYQNISSERILANLAALKTHAPQLRYIQIDDGYQPWMGDWLDSTDKFVGGVQPVIRSIRDSGFEPAIWVAPFIASPQSRLFREHPEWFVRGADGRPLRSDKVTFGGWRQSPWYMLDATHPEARAYLETVFRTLRSWGCTYFKLDANLWGAFPPGRRHDPQATSVEAYRAGMDAIRRGAGPDSLLLACNQAYWPSLGTVHASRTSFDIGRDLTTFRRVARQNLLRNWMNDRLWWNDPDCLLIPDVTPSDSTASGFDPGPTFSRKKKITPDHFAFHAAATYASGGMILSGDAVADYSPAQWALLHRALVRPPIAARFADDRLEVGVIDEPTRRVVALLNWDDTQATRRVPVSDRFRDTAVRVTDFWTDRVVSTDLRGDMDLVLPPGGGRVLVLEKMSDAPAR